MPNASVPVNPVTNRPVPTLRLVNGQTTASGYRALVPTNAVAPTIFLPPFASAQSGDMVLIDDDSNNALANPITLNGNGTTIDGAATLVLSVNSVRAALEFDGGQWRRVLPPRRFDDEQLDDLGYPVSFRAQDLLGMLPSGSTPTGTGFAHITAGVQDAAAKLVVNADVGAAAAIAGTKIAPDFGAQDVVTTGVYKGGGATVASAGVFRAPNNLVALAIRNGTNASDINAISVSNADNMYVGANIAQSTGGLGSILYFASGVHQLLVGGVEKITFAANGIQIGAGAQDFGSGVGVIGIDNAGTDPTTNPTGGAIQYASGGAIVGRGSGGTTTTMAAA